MERTRDLQNKNSQLRHIETSRKSFFSSVTHEIGTPMQSIQGYIQLMQSKTQSDEMLQYLNVVYEKTKLLNRLSKDLLELAKLDEEQLEFHFEYINIYFFLDHIYKQLRYDIEKEGIQFVQTAPDSQREGTPLFAWLDVIRMEQVFVNLVHNAMKFTPPGGKIELIGSYVANKDNLQNGLLFIKITDTGQGIDVDLLPHVFERFVKGKTQSQGRKGSGLGLSICMEIIKRHRGSITVESELGKGSTFTITLPAYSKKEGTQLDQKNHDC